MLNSLSTKLKQKRYFQPKKEKKWISLGSQFQLQQFYFLKQISQKRILPVEIWKYDSHHWIFHIRISLNIKFQFKLTSLIFWKKQQKKWTSCSACSVSLGTEFQFKLTILIFWKGIFGRKRKSWTATLNFTYSN